MDVAAAPTEPGGVAERRKRTEYKPHLDGIRTLAVYVVVAFHAGLGVMSGGFIGVDIFFVLSGFLVTNLLLSDLVRSGRVQLQRFYSRRVRRILPASLVTLVVTAVLYSIIATPNELLDAFGGFRAAFFYVANWHFISQSTDYFAANVNTNPVLHFWSLAVEEQFYLVWPIVLGALYLISRLAGRWRWWILRAIVGGLVIASAIEAHVISGTNLNRAYYGTDTRAYQLLAGALLAMTPQLLQVLRRRPRAAQTTAAVALGGLALLATSLWRTGPITRGMVTALLAVTLIAALGNATGGLAKRILSSPKVTYLGRISYGTYLWHWPLIILLTHDRRISPLPLFLVSAVGATMLAAASFHLLEHPIRVAKTLDRYRTPVIAIGFATSILIGWLAMPVILDKGSSTVAAVGATGTGPRLLDWRKARLDFPHTPDCLGHSVSVCTVVRGHGLHVVLMGDSQAQMWLPAFEAIAKRDSLTLTIAAHSGCRWQLHLVRELHLSRVCEREQRDWYSRVIPQIHPDIVVVAQVVYDDPLLSSLFELPDGRTITATSPDFERLIKSATADSIKRLEQSARQVVILEPAPGHSLSYNPLSCLSAGKPASACAFHASSKPTELERFFQTEADRDPRVKVVNLNRLLCPRLPTCDAVVGQIIAWRDADHITETFSRSLATPVEAILERQHIVGPGS